MQCVLGALVAVEGYGEAVYLVLQMGENVEQFAVGLQSDGLRRVAIEQFVGAVAVVLGESGYGDAQPEFAFYCPIPPSVTIKSGRGCCSSIILVYLRRTTSCIEA